MPRVQETEDCNDLEGLEFLWDGREVILEGFRVSLTRPMKHVCFIIETFNGARIFLSSARG
jgi:hypothetical protein